MLIEMNGLHVELLRKKVKNINLRVDKHGTVKVSVPMQCSLQFVQHYLSLKQEWIRAHRHRFMQTESHQHVLHYETGERHYFLGCSYELVLHETTQKKHVTFENNQLHLFVTPKASILEKKILLQAWYQQQMMQCLPALVEKWEAVIGVCVEGFRIRAMKTRWGSCHVVKRCICLNVHLIKHKPVCLEYVLVHEMVHLLEPSHNQRFHALMSYFMPEWREHKACLKKELL
jgi:predicted metal-dependent hydrolase